VSLEEVTEHPELGMDIVKLAKSKLRAELLRLEFRGAPD
jgi:hypothetical protein